MRRAALASRLWFPLFNISCPMTAIRLSLVEDDPQTRESLVALLAGHPEVVCLGAYATAEAALQGIPKDKPDVALIDINLPGLNGIACVTKLRDLLPSIQVLILTTYEETDLIFEALRAGASGYLLKKKIAAELLPAIEQVHAGGAPFSMEIARKVVEHLRAPKLAKPAGDAEVLTAREEELLALLAGGALYKEIGDKLGISYNTVRAHFRSIYRKLHVQSRSQAMLKYLGQRNSSS